MDKELLINKIKFELNEAEQKFGIYWNKNKELENYFCGKYQALKDY